MKVPFALLALVCLVPLAGKDKTPPAPAADKVVVLEPMKIHENPIISFAIDVTVYSDPATKKINRMFIARVLENSDAAEAGLQADDEIVKLDGIAVKELDAVVSPDSPLGRIFLNRFPGDPLTLEVITHRTEKLTLHAQRALPGWPH